MPTNSLSRYFKGPRVAVYTALAIAVTALVLTPNVERQITGTTVSLLAAKSPQIETIDQTSVELVRSAD